MISSIKFKTGPSPQAAPAQIEPAPITIFVGPNNSGKSRVLIELEAWSDNGNTNRGSNNTQSVIIDQILFSALTKEEVMYELELLKTSTHGTIEQGQVHLIKGSKNQSVQLDIDTIIQEASSPVPNAGLNHYAYLRSFLTLRLDGKTRLSMLDETAAGDLQNPHVESSLGKLFRDNNLRTNVRKIIYDSIGRHFVIDPTNLGKLRVRFSNRAPNYEAEERGITEESVAFHSAADPIEKVSDGVNAFSGIITTLIADNPRIILIDEPEAFLHPALAMKLGKEIGRSIDNRKQLFVATHSASFIMGCIQSNSPINIIRFTYKNGVGSTRILERSKLLHLMRNPMLRSTGVLDGLFFEAVIVTEADADRAFYQEINERLRTANDPRGISNCLFLNAQNKQTVWDIVKPLRELGIPAVGIIDLDMVKDGGSDFTRIMEGAFVPTMQHHSMSEMRAQIRKALDASVPSTAQPGDITKNWWKRNGGIELLDTADKQAANSYFAQLEAFGAFVVRSGELEVWLKHLKVPANKKRWLSDIFIAMGEDPTLADYVAPGQGDVWDFMGRIKQWVENPVHFGIPD